jgi:hypothetical protein
VLLCCKVCAGLVVNATAIIPQTDKALRVLLAVGFRVLDGLLDIDFRRGWFVNCAHLTSYAVAYSEIQCGLGGLWRYAGVLGLYKPADGAIRYPPNSIGL